MKRTHSLMIALLTAAALGFGFLGLNTPDLQAQARQHPPTSVGVVNVADLIADCQRNVSFQESMQQRRQGLQAEAQQKEQAIQTMILDLDTIPGNQPAERRAKEREIITARTEYAAWQQIQQELLRGEQRVFLIDLYGEINDTVSAIAQREGYDIILFDTPRPNFEQLNVDQLVQVIGERRVVYRSNDVDITTMVLEQMNLAHIQRTGNN